MVKEFDVTINYRMYIIWDIVLYIWCSILFWRPSLWMVEN